MPEAALYGRRFHQGFSAAKTGGTRPSVIGNGVTKVLKSIPPLGVEANVLFSSLGEIPRVATSNITESVANASRLEGEVVFAR